MTPLIDRLSPAHRLAIHCCRASYGDPHAKVAQFADLVDWADVLAVARRHRIRPLVRQGLDASDVRLPEAIAAALHADCTRLAAATLKSLVAARGIGEALGAAGVDHLVVKGAALATLAYAEPTLKESIDIDLLVSPDQVEAAGRVLALLGFQLRVPNRIDRLGAWHRRRKESVWTNGPLMVDLHGRLADNPRSLRGVDLAAPRRMVTVAPGIALPTLCEGPMVAHLAVHGASSGWFRLKWLSDFAAILHRSTDVDSLHDAGRALASRRAVDLAFQLSSALFETPMPASLGAPGRVERLLLSRALALILAGEPTERRLGTGDIHLWQFLTAPNPAGDIARQLGEAWFSARSAVQ